MIHIGAGYLAGWGNLSEDDRAAALELARKAWDDDASWSELSEAAKIFAVLKLPLVTATLLDPPDPFRDTVKCLNCRDTGFQPGKVYGLWFCSVCDKGLVLEAGYWRRTRFPEVRGRRVASASGQRQFKLYAAAKPHRAERVRAEITRLVRQEQERADQETET